MSGRLFGTNGIRGVINEGMTSDLALHVGKAIGTVMGGTVAIATDTRISADMIRTAVSAGIMSVGVDVLDLGVIPTPALQYYVKTHGNVKGGVMITASHNPPEFNGIKCISQDGTETSREEEEKIEEQYPKDIPCASWNMTGSMSRVSGVAEEYVDAIISMVDADSIRKAGLKVCLDCANGAAYETAPLLLRKLNVRAVTINCNPQGEFPGHL
ncbi:MAG: phosphoglucosamine mutase, partial [Candidatus Methanoplasma sp.]|nr:phosphoglucosamine mutase [Candidatus Methanoplasma sp.]